MIKIVMRKFYTLKEVVEKLDIPERRIRHWAKNVVKPWERGRGRGHVNRYSERNLRQFEILDNSLMRHRELINAIQQDFLFTG